jgi:hypothetical protein
MVAIGRFVVFGVLAILLGGCGREEVRTYQTPKQKQPVATVVKAVVPMAGKGFSATLPTGWTEKAGSGMRTVSYSIDETSIDFYLIPLRVGDVPSNVNRWRGQVGLPPESPEAIAEKVETFQVDGHATHYIEIYNSENNRGIVAAIVDLAPEYWYFTAKGPASELKIHAREIRAFLESLKIGLGQ